MKSFLISRALPFALLLVAVVVSTGAAVTLVYSKGLAFMSGAEGLLLQIPILLVFALATFVVLTRVKKLPPSAVGFAFDSRAGRELAVSTLSGIAIVTGAALALWAAGLAPFTVSSAPPTASVLVIALLASIVNA